MTQKQFDFLYHQAKKLMSKTKDPVHDWSHIERVIDNVFKIKKSLPQAIQLKLDDKILTLAAAWHDISFVFYQAGIIQYFREAKRGTQITKKYCGQINLSPEETNLICDIISHHVGSCFGFLNKKLSLYHQIIQDADTLDSFASPKRVAQAQKAAKKSWYYKFMIKILEPLFYNFLVNHKKIIYNLPYIIKEIKITHKRN